MKAPKTKGNSEMRLPHKPWVRWMGLMAPIFILPLMSAVGTTPQQSPSHAKGNPVDAEFIFEKAPFKSCHASTIAETKHGLIAAWFGGTNEGKPDVGIWISRRDSRGWTTVEEIATGKQSNGKRLPCWNPVLFHSNSGRLLLFYKVGPSASTWWGMLMNSDDEGKTWSAPKRLPEGILGPVKNKPIELPHGKLLAGSSSEQNGWRVHMEETSDLGRTWTHTPPLNDGKILEAIQPAILRYPSGRMQILCRTKQRKLAESWSEGEGKHWSAMQLIELPNPNSGIDATVLSEGQAWLVFNDSADKRTPLKIAVSDDGAVWKTILTLENQAGEYSYPAIIQSSDGMIHITYTWNRTRIKHVAVDPSALQPHHDLTKGNR